PAQDRAAWGPRVTSIATLVFVALVGYAIGSISSGYLVGKIYRNVDLRTVGSGSTGATNTFRTLGTGAGLLVAVLDILKGSLAVVFAQLVFPAGPGRPLAEAIAAVAAVTGHCWPATLRGRGGRGVATGFGALLFAVTVTVLQAGSWGTTLATILARDGGKDVVLWTRDPAQAKEISARRENRRYLAGIRVPDRVEVTADLERALASADLIVATPSRG